MHVRAILASLIVVLLGTCEATLGMGIGGGGGGGPTGPRLHDPLATVALSDIPGRVAARPHGGFVVAVPSRNLVRSYDAVGTEVGALVVSGDPISVGVLHNGDILVGNGLYGEVARYNATGFKVGFLGRGYGEFGKPVDLAVDGARMRIYVADAATETVQAYRWDGMPLGSLGGPGTGDGRFEGLNSVAVDPRTGEVLAIDFRRTRVQIFGPDLAFAGVLAVPAGDQEGQITRPAGLAVDGSGRIFVTDSYHGWVQCFHRSGTYMGWSARYGAGAGGLLNPGDIAVDAGGALIVGMSGAARVELYSDASGTPASVPADSMPVLRPMLLTFPEGHLRPSSPEVLVFFRVELWGTQLRLIDKGSVRLGGVLPVEEIRPVEGERSGVFEFAFLRADVAALVRDAGGSFLATVSGDIRECADRFEGTVRVELEGYVPPPAESPPPPDPAAPSSSRSSWGCGGPGSPGSALALLILFWAAAAGLRGTVRREGEGRVR